MVVKQTVLVLMGFMSTWGKEADSERASTPTGDLRHQGLAGRRRSECCGTLDALNRRAASSAVCHGKAVQGWPSEEGGAQNQAVEVERTRGTRHPAGAAGERGASRMPPRVRAARAEVASHSAPGEPRGRGMARLTVPTVLVSRSRSYATPMKPWNRRRSHESGAQGTGWPDTARGAVAKGGLGAQREGSGRRQDFGSASEAGSAAFSLSFLYPLILKPSDFQKRCQTERVPLTLSISCSLAQCSQLRGSVFSPPSLHPPQPPGLPAHASVTPLALCAAPCPQVPAPPQGEGEGGRGA